MLKKIHKTFIATMAVTTVVAPTTLANVEFKDVKSTDYFAEAVQSLVERGIIKGYTEDQTFRPNKDVTRGQAAKMIAGVLGFDTLNVTNPQFKDVPQTNEYYGAIAALAERGIINGYPETGTFKPNQPMTRHQMAKVISLAFELQAKNTDLPFTDVSKSYEKYVAALVEHNITTGKTETTFSGSSNVTRGQLAAFIYRAETSVNKSKIVEISGEISEITDKYIVIDGVKYSVSSQLQTIFNETNAEALQGAVVKTKAENNFINVVKTLTITQEGTKEKPIVLQEITKPTASVVYTAAEMSNIQQLVLQSKYVEVRNVQVPQLIISSVAQFVTLLGNFENVTISEGSHATLQGDATIQQLLVESKEAIVVNVIGEIVKVLIHNKANINLGAKTIITELDAKGVDPATIFTNYNEVKNNIKTGTQGSSDNGSPGTGSGTVITPGGAGSGSSNNGNAGNTGGSNGNDSSNDNQTEKEAITVEGTVTSASSSEVTINGTTYSVDSKFKNLFSNTTVNNAEVKVTVKDDKIVAVTNITIKSSGTLDGDGATIVGKLTVDADKVKVENLTVTGDVLLTAAVQESIDFNGVNIQGTVLTEETTVAKARTARAIAAVNPIVETEKPKTTLKITFANSVIAYIEIKKVDTTLSVIDATQISLLKVESNGISIEASKDVVLPNLNISKGVTQIELNASIAKVEIDTNDDIKIFGSGNFQSVEIKTDKSVELATTGTIATLATDNKNVTLGDAVQVGATTDTKGDTKPPEQLITNIDQVSKNVNVEIKQDEFIGYITAKVIPVEDKFGYVTLSVLNVGNSTIKYRFVNRNQETLPTIGSKAPADAVVYKAGDEFIAWYSKDLQVFAVNDKDEVIDTYKIQSFGTFTHPLAKLKVENNKIILESIFAPLMRFNEGYFVNNNQFYMPDNAKQFTSKIDATGVPVFELELPSNFKYDAQNMATFSYYLSGINASGNTSGGLLSWGNIGLYNSEQDDANDLLALKNFLQKDLTQLQEGEFWIEAILNRHAYTVEEVKDEEGKFLYNKHNSKVQPIIIEKYIEALRASELTTIGDIVKIVDEVNVANQDLVALFYEAEKAMDLIYKEDMYEYSQYEQLKDGVTKADIEAAEKLVQELQTKLQNSKIQDMVNLVRSAYRNLEMLEVLQNFAPIISNYDSTKHKEQFANLLNVFTNDIAIEPLMDQYVTELKKMELLTPLTFQAAIAEVNGLEANKQIAQSFKEAKAAVDALFVANKYAYDSYERLAEGVTEAQIAAAEKLATAAGLTDIVGSITHNISEARNIYDMLQLISKLNETAKTYVVATSEEQLKMFGDLNEYLKRIAPNDYIEILFSNYIAAISNEKAVTLKSIKELIKTVNADAENVQLAQAYKNAKKAVDTLFKENYQSIENIDEQLNYGVTEQQFLDAEAQVNALNVEEQFKQSLVSEINQVRRIFMAKSDILALQEKAKAHLATDKTMQYYSDIRNILQNITFSNLGDGKFGHLHDETLLDLYIEDFAKNKYTTIAEVKAAIRKVNAANESIIELSKKVQELNENGSLRVGTTLEYISNLQLQVERLDGNNETLLQNLLKVKALFYKATERPEQIQSVIVTKSKDVEHTFTFTFTDAVDLQNITFELEGLQQDVDYEVTNVQYSLDRPHSLYINVKKIKPLTFSTISIEGVTLAESDDAVELKSVPLVNWSK